MNQMDFKPIRSYDNYTSYLRIKNIKKTQKNKTVITNKKWHNNRLNRINGFVCGSKIKGCCNYRIVPQKKI